MKQPKDYCTWFFDNWFRYGEDLRIESFYIGDICKAHDDVDDSRGGCASTTFAKLLWKHRVVGAIPIFIVASLACWIKYPKSMWSRL